MKRRGVSFPSSNFGWHGRFHRAYGIEAYWPKLGELSEYGEGIECGMSRVDCERLPPFAAHARTPISGERQV